MDIPIAFPIRRRFRHAILARMTDHTDFIEQGLHAAREALIDIGGAANLHLKPETISKSARRRCLAGFRQVAILIRRLLFLMALAIELAPARPRAARPAALPPEGVEDVTATFGPQAGRFGLAPRLSGPLPDCFRPLSGPHISGPVPAAPLIARWVALLRVLKNPDAHARRLARTLRRWQARGEPRPHIAPMVARHRLRESAMDHPGLITAVVPAV